MNVDIQRFMYFLDYVLIPIKIQNIHSLFFGTIIKNDLGSTFNTVKKGLTHNKSVCCRDY